MLFLVRAARMPWRVHSFCVARRFGNLSDIDGMSKNFRSNNLGIFLAMIAVPTSVLWDVGELASTRIASWCLFLWWIEHFNSHIA